jgi:hypothetical protein
MSSVNAHDKNLDYPLLYRLYNNTFDEMIYSREFEKNVEVDIENYKYSKKKSDLSFKALSENGAVFPIEGTQGTYLLENSIIQRQASYETFSNVGVASTYKVYDGHRKRHEKNMYRYKAKATKLLTARHKRHRVRFYIDKIIRYYCLQERMKQMNTSLNILRKLRKRYIGLNKNKGVSVLKVDLIESRLMMYEQKIEKMKTQAAYSFGFLHNKSKRFIQTYYTKLVKEFEKIIAHDHKYKVKYCNSTKIDTKFLKMSSLAFQEEAKVKETDYKPRIEFRNSVNRRHMDYFNRAESDFSSSIFITIPLFESKARKHTRSIGRLKSLRAKAEINYINKQNLEYERAYQLEISQRKKLIESLERQVKKIKKKRYFSTKILRVGIVKVEDYLGLMDVLISTNEFLVDEKWKYIGTYFNNSMLCTFHKKKGV